jgi:hypothetical protein
MSTGSGLTVADVQKMIGMTVANLTTKVAGLQEENRLLQSRVDELESEPDPAKAPLRGGRTTERTTVEKRAKQEAENLEVAEKAARDADAAARREYLERLAGSGDPETRERARAVLRRLG